MHKIKKRKQAQAEVILKRESKLSDVLSDHLFIFLDIVRVYLILSEDLSIRQIRESGQR